MTRLVVADGGPLIGLAKTGHLNLLRSLFGAVMIPPAVLDELSITSDREGAACLREAIDAAGWIRTMSIRAPEAVSGLSLGPGESEAIALALEQKAILLIDERRGRIAARGKGVDPSEGMVDRDTLVRSDLDSVAHMTETTLRAWGIPFSVLRNPSNLEPVRDAFHQAQEEKRPVAVLLDTSFG